MLNRLLSFFFILTFLAGCQEESEIIPFQKTKSALSGTWDLVSYEYQEYEYDESPGLHFPALLPILFVAF
jgi:hypothetical protein